MQKPDIEWFPGHMKKTERMIARNLSKVDLVLELADARVPRSSRNPSLGKLIGKKPRIVVLGKSDMADPNVTKKWLAAIAQEGYPALAVDCRNQKGIERVIPLIRETLQELLLRRQKRGMAGRMVRVMVVGIPNVGKSTFINRLAGKNRAKAEDRPGVTRQQQWVHVQGDVDLLDMPGTLWPKFEDQDVGLHLAFTGAIKDDVFDVEFVAMHLIDYLWKHYPQAVMDRFSVRSLEGLEPFEQLEALGKSRGMLLRGAEVDTERAAAMLLHEYRAGKLGRITLEELHEPV